MILFLLVRWLDVCGLWWVDEVGIDEVLLEEKECFGIGSSALWYALRCRFQLTSAKLTGTQQ
jgi:hypothetical protein